MNKILETYRLIGEYPGLTRTIQVFDDNIIEIEFNISDSDEIGVRFWKKFINPIEENIRLQSYFANSANELEKQQIYPEMIKASWIKLLEDTYNNQVKLPDDNYEYKGNRDEIIDTIEYVKTEW